MKDSEVLAGRAIRFWAESRDGCKQSKSGISHQATNGKLLRSDPTYSVHRPTYTPYRVYEVQGSDNTGYTRIPCKTTPFLTPSQTETKILLGYTLNLKMRSATNAIRFSGRRKIPQLLRIDFMIRRVVRNLKWDRMDIPQRRLVIDIISRKSPSLQLIP